MERAPQQGDWHCFLTARFVTGQRTAHQQNFSRTLAQVRLSAMTRSKSKDPRPGLGCVLVG